MAALKPFNFRSLRFGRTKYRPGIGICCCESCSGLARFGNRVGMHLRLGTPNPNCQYINREEIFAAEWAAEHEHTDLAQLLMQRPPKPGERRRLFCLTDPIAFWLSYRERVIIATIIQWLGTNVGWCFLERCIRKCGYELVKRQEQREERVA